MPALYRLIVVLLLLLGMLPRTAMAEGADLRLAYDIEWGRLILARSAVHLRQGDQRATIKARAESGGIASVISQFQSDATARLARRQQRWQSEQISMRRRSGKKTYESRVTWDADGSIIESYRAPDLDLGKVHPLNSRFARPVLDPYAAILQLLQRLDDGKDCRADFEVFDGRRHARLRVEPKAMVMLQADRRAGYAGEALLCEVSLVPLGGHRLTSKQDNPRVIKVYLGRPLGERWLPVRIEVKGWIGRVIARLNLAMK